MKRSPSRKKRLDKLRSRLLLGGSALFLVAAVIFYLSGGRYVSTDDAYVKAARVKVSADISGRVKAVEVKDNQFVRAGEPLFRLDARTLRIAVQDARANLAGARLRIASLEATYRQRQADVQAAEDTQAYEKLEYARQKKLAAQGIASQEKLAAARHAFLTAGQKLNAARQLLLNARAALDGNPELPVDRQPSVQAARATLDQAKLNLSYAVVKAPIDGIVSKVDLLQVGDYIKASEPVFALTSRKDVWVEANFRETDLTYMRPGQTASIDIDAYPDHDFKGQVDSLSPGTGSSYSILPPENATGNWVKVVQRLPVRIRIDHLDPKLALHAGLSAVVKVDTHHSRLKGWW